MTHVVVVGAGIAGACVADQLARETDASVTVVERRRRPASETTAKSGAFVGFWGHEPPALVPHLRYGIDFYARALSRRDVPARFVHGGRLRLATTAEGAEAIRADVETWCDRWNGGHGDSTPTDPPPTGSTAGPDATARTFTVGAPVQYLPGDAVRETLVLPGVDVDAVTGALYSPGVGYVDDPGALARSLLQRAQDAGATVQTGTTVRAVVTSGDPGAETAGDRQVTAVRLDAGTVDADAVVAAAGPWNRRLLSTADVELPVRNTRGPILTLETDAHGVPALYHEETGVYTRTNRDGSLYLGRFPGQYDVAERLDPADVPNAVDETRREQCLSVLETLCPGSESAPLVDEWVGVRTLTPDGLPVAGETDVSGLSVVAFNANGIQYAPAAGRLLAAQFGADDADLPADPLAFDRFG